MPLSARPMSGREVAGEGRGARCDWLVLGPSRESGRGQSAAGGSWSSSQLGSCANGCVLHPVEKAVTEVFSRMGEIEISARAYIKMCLHAARYPHAGVNGLLLAKRCQATVAGQPECLCVTDCIPLFHSNLSLTVMLEVALNQVDIWSSQSDLLLAGYYQANSGIDDKNPSPLALKTAGRIAELYGDAVLIMLDNRKFITNPRVPPLIVLEQKDRQWIPKDKNLVMWSDWESSRHICKSLLEAKAYAQLVDFDAHLDDIREDWTNQQLNTEIAQLISVANGIA